MGKNNPSKKDRKKKGAIGQSKFRGEYFNPTTGKPETQAQQTARVTREKKFVVGGKEVSESEYKHEKERARMEVAGGRPGKPVEPEKELGDVIPAGIPPQREPGMEFQPEGERISGKDIEIRDIQNKLAEPETGEVLDTINRERLKIKLENLLKFQENPVLGGSLPIGIPMGVLTSAGGSAWKGIEAAMKVQKTTKVAKAEQVGGILGYATPITKVATNAKSITLTKNFAIGLGLSVFGANLLVEALGTYPFAGFIKEEASQTTGFGFFQAEKNDDIQGMEEAIMRQEELINAAPSILNKIPYLNILEQVKEFFKSVSVKLETDKRILEKKRLELTGQKD